MILGILDQVNSLEELFMVLAELVRPGQEYPSLTRRKEMPDLVIGIFLITLFQWDKSQLLPQDQETVKLKMLFNSIIGQYRPS